MHRLCVTPPKTILGPGNLCPQLPSHSAPFHPFFKVSPDACKSDLVPTPSQSNMLSSILRSPRFSPLLLKTEQLLCRIPRPAGTTAKPAATKRISFLCTLCTTRALQRMEELQRLFPQLTAFSALKMCWDSSGFFSSSFPSILTPNPVFLWGLKVSQTLGKAEGVCYRMVCAHTGHISQVNGKPSVTDLGLPKPTPQPSHLNLFPKSSASCFSYTSAFSPGWIPFLSQHSLHFQSFWQTQ